MRDTENKMMAINEEEMEKVTGGTGDDYEYNSIRDLNDKTHRRDMDTESTGKGSQNKS